MKIFTLEQIIHLRVNISCMKQFYRIWATSLPGSSPTRPSQRGREGSCSSCSEEKPNNTKTIGRMTCHCLERESKLSLCLSLLGSSRRGSWERGWHIPTLQASARANPLPSRIIRCHGNFLDMVLNSNRPDGSLFTVENIPARINLTNPDQTWNFIPYTVSSTGCSKKHPVHQWAQLFEGRLALNLGLNLTLVSFSCAQKHFLG